LIGTVQVNNDRKFLKEIVDEGLKLVAEQMKDTELNFKYGKLFVEKTEQLLDGNEKLRNYASLLASVVIGDIFNLKFPGSRGLYSL
jgi:hypothetical protein